jgi:predicted DNA-binding protein YlxM (UPF0122 family)
MLLKMPKTGLANNMREWMKARVGTILQRRFTMREMAEALSVSSSDARTKLRDALKDFIARGEVKVLIYKKHKRRQNIYIHDWRKDLKGDLNKKIFKAMYISQSFSISDIQRLTGIKDRHYLDRITRKIKQEGHLQQIARRHCIHGAGVEKIYHIMNRDRFNLEIMKGN